MKDGFIFIFSVAVFLLVYFFGIVPFRAKLCEKHNMTAVWYITGCVNKE